MKCFVLCLNLNLWSPNSERSFVSDGRIQDHSAVAMDRDSMHTNDGTEPRSSFFLGYYANEGDTPDFRYTTEHRSPTKRVAPRSRKYNTPASRRLWLPVRVRPYTLARNRGRLVWDRAR